MITALGGLFQIKMVCWALVWIHQAINMLVRCKQWAPRDNFTFEPDSELCKISSDDKNSLKVDTNVLFSCLLCHGANKGMNREAWEVLMAKLPLCLTVLQAGGHIPQIKPGRIDFHCLLVWGTRIRTGVDGGHCHGRQLGGDKRWPSEITFSVPGWAVQLWISPC